MLTQTSLLLYLLLQDEGYWYNNLLYIYSVMILHAYVNICIAIYYVMNITSCMHYVIYILTLILHIHIFDCHSVETCIYVYQESHGSES